MGSRSRLSHTVFQRESPQANAFNPCLRSARHTIAAKQKGVFMKSIQLAVIVALAIAFSQSMTALAQPRETTSPPQLTLQEAVQTALKQHPVLQSSEFAVQSADARVKQAQSSYYPQVGGSAVQTNGSLRANALFLPSGSLIESNRSDFSVGVVAKQLVYDFGQTKYRVES